MEKETGGEGSEWRLNGVAREVSSVHLGPCSELCFVGEQGTAGAGRALLDVHS